MGLFSDLTDYEWDKMEYPLVSSSMAGWKIPELNGDLKEGQSVKTVRTLRSIDYTADTFRSKVMNIKFTWDLFASCFLSHEF